MPTGYRLEYDPDVLVLRRGDGSQAAAFSARVPTPRRWSRVAREDEPDRLVGREPMLTLLHQKLPRFVSVEAGTDNLSASAFEQEVGTDGQDSLTESTLLDEVHGVAS